MTTAPTPMRLAKSLTETEKHYGWTTSYSCKIHDCIVTVEEWTGRPFKECVVIGGIVHYRFKEMDEARAKKHGPYWEVDAAEMMQYANDIRDSHRHAMTAAKAVGIGRQ